MGGDEDSCSSSEVPVLEPSSSTIEDGEPSGFAVSVPVAGAVSHATRSVVSVSRIVLYMSS